MLRVLHVIGSLGAGGAEKLVAGLARRRSPGTSVGVCVLGSPMGTAIEESLSRAGVPVWFMSKHRGPDLRVPLRIARVISVFRPHVVHTHGYAIRYSLAAQTLRSVPLSVHTLHNVPPRETDAVGRWINLVAFRRNWVRPIAITKLLANETARFYGLAAMPPVVYNGLDLTELTRLGQKESRLLLGIPAEAKLVVNVGRLAPQKNHELLLLAFVEVRKVIPECVLAIVGDGPLRPRIEELARRLGVERQVLLLGVRRDVSVILSASDVFALSSSWEGLPFAVLEAMATELPVVATQVGGVPEAVNHDVTGFLVPPGDPNGFAAALVKALTLPQPSKSAMGRRAREYVVAHFDLRATVRAYESLYTSWLRDVYLRGKVREAARGGQPPSRRLMIPSK